MSPAAKVQAVPVQQGKPFITRQGPAAGLGSRPVRLRVPHAAYWSGRFDQTGLPQDGQGQQQARPLDAGAVTGRRCRYSAGSDSGDAVGIRTTELPGAVTYGFDGATGRRFAKTPTQIKRGLGGGPLEHHHVAVDVQ